MTNDFVVIGLGNPGDNYKNTRHNVGFSVLDLICKEFNLKWKVNIFNNFVYQSINNITLIKPLTYMNNSGLVLKKVKKMFFKDNTTVVVICDNMDLPSSNIRLKNNGKQSSQKGLASILSYIDRSFLCLFIGISRPPANVSVVDYVLGKLYKKDEIEAINAGIKKASKLIQRLKKDNIDFLMNEFNKK